MEPPAEQVRSRRSWYKDLTERLDSREPIDFGDVLTVLYPDRLFIDINECFTTYYPRHFLQAVAYYCAPTPYELLETFTPPACLVVTRGLFRKVTHHIVQAPDMTIILKVKGAS